MTCPIEERDEREPIPTSRPDREECSIPDNILHLHVKISQNDAGQQRRRVHVHDKQCVPHLHSYEKDTQQLNHSLCM